MFIANCWAKFNIFHNFRFCFLENERYYVWDILKFKVSKHFDQKAAFSYFTRWLEFSPKKRRLDVGFYIYLSAKTLT